LVRTVALLDLVKLHDDDGGYVDRADRGSDRFFECMAARELFRLLCVLPFVRRREQRLLELSVGWHVA
jgi:hypothetical protein